MIDLSQAEDQFQKYFDRLIIEALHARAHINLWERLEKYKSTDYIDELNQARYFFTFTTKAHLDDVLLTLSRILDKQKDSLSIWKFLCFIEQNIEMFSYQYFHQRIIKKPGYDEDWDTSYKAITLKEIEEDRSKLESLRDTVNSLTKWRDKVIAHIDRQFLLSGKIVAKEYPLKIQQLQEVVNTIFQILNRYLGAFNSSSYAEIYPGEGDVQFIMDCVRFYIEEHKRQIDAELELLKRQRLNTK